MAVVVRYERPAGTSPHVYSAAVVVKAPDPPVIVGFVRLCTETRKWVARPRFGAAIQGNFSTRTAACEFLFLVSGQFKRRPPVSA